MTIRRRKGRIEGLTVGLVGDIAHSRVARSNIWGLTKLGRQGHPLRSADARPARAGTARLRGRLQPRRDPAALRRRQRPAHPVRARSSSGLFPSIAEYSALYGMTRERLAQGEGRPAAPGAGPDQPRRRADARGRRRARTRPSSIRSPTDWPCGWPSSISSRDERQGLDDQPERTRRVPTIQHHAAVG